MLVKTAPRSDDESIAVSQEDVRKFLAPSVSHVMRAMEAIMVEVAATDIPVLLTGETGTGKEIAALTIHQFSRRRSGPFIKIRCSTLKPDDLNHLLPKSREDSQLSRLSTVLLDEIADLSASCQTRLLDAFSQPDGGPEKFQLGAGVISTTCQNLEGALQAGYFRQDLYHLLSGVSLRLPPLRQRQEDIGPLADFFLDKYSALFSRPRPPLGAALMGVLQEYAWPGNIRELENTMRRMVALGDEHLALKGLGGSGHEASGPKPEREVYSLKQIARAASRRAEQEVILKVLSRTRWNRKRAAEELQISYKALLYKLKQIGAEESAS